MNRRRHLGFAIALAIVVNLGGLLLLVRVVRPPEPEIASAPVTFSRPITMTATPPSPDPAPPRDRTRLRPRRTPRTVPVIPIAPSALRTDATLVPRNPQLDLIAPMLDGDGLDASDLGAVIMDEDAVDVAPTEIERVEPTFPRRARMLGIEGKVVARILVDIDGRVAEVIIESADPPGFFEREVERALQRWRFTPGQYQGDAVAVRLRVPFSFTLNDD